MNHMQSNHDSLELLRSPKNGSDKENNNIYKCITQPGDQQVFICLVRL